MIKNQNDSLYSNQKALQAGLEEGRFKWVLKILKEKETQQNLFMKKLSPLHTYVLAKLMNVNDLEKITNDDDRSLQDLIRNKTVAVVGPAPIDDLEKTR